VDDTHPEARRVQIDLLRKAGPRRRAALASNMTNQALWRARRGIALAHPELSKLERDLLFVEVHYGRDLARRLRTWLESRQQVK
jgi:hypothetical protein